MDQQQRRPERADQTEQLAPRQRRNVQVEDERRRGQGGREQVQRERDGREPRKMRRVARGGLVDLVVKREHGAPAGIVLGLRAGGQRDRPQLVQLREVMVADFHPRNIFAAHGEGLRIDDDDRPAEVARVGHDLRRAAAAARGFAVPHGDEHIAVVHGFHAAVEIGIVALVALADHADVLGLGEERLDVAPFALVKVAAEFRRRQRQHRLPAHTDLERGAGEQRVAADCDRGEGEPFNAGLRAQFREHPAQHALDSRGVCQPPVAGETRNMDDRELVSGGRHDG